MQEVVVDHREIVAMVHRVHQLLAHTHQRRGSAGGEIEAPKKLQPPRLGGAVDVRGRGVRGRGEIGTRRGAQSAAVWAEPPRQRLEEGDARAGLQIPVA